VRTPASALPAAAATDRAFLGAPAPGARFVVARFLVVPRVAIADLSAGNARLQFRAAA
jgi:hypothetical protein